MNKYLFIYLLGLMYFKFIIDIKYRYVFGDFKYGLML